MTKTRFVTARGNDGEDTAEGKSATAASIAERLAAGERGEENERRIFDDARALARRLARSPTEEAELDTLAESIGRVVAAPPSVATDAWLGALLAAAQLLGQKPGFLRGLEKEQFDLRGGSSWRSLAVLAAAAELPVLATLLRARLGDAILAEIASDRLQVLLKNAENRRRALDVAAWLLETFDEEAGILEPLRAAVVSVLLVELPFEDLALAARALLSGASQRRFLKSNEAVLLVCSLRAVDGWVLAETAASAQISMAAKLALLRAALGRCEPAALLLAFDSALETVKAAAGDAATRLLAQATLAELAIKVAAALNSTDTKVDLGRGAVTIAQIALREWPLASTRALSAAASRTFEASLTLLAAVDTEAVYYSEVLKEIAGLPVRFRLNGLEIFVSCGPKRVLETVYDPQISWALVLEASGSGESGIKRSAARLAAVHVSRAKRVLPKDTTWLADAASAAVSGLSGSASEARRLWTAEHLLPAMHSAGLSKDILEKAIISTASSSEVVGMRVLARLNVELADLAEALKSADALVRTRALESLELRASDDEEACDLLCASVSEALCDATVTSKQIETLGRRIGRRAFASSTEDGPSSRLARRLVGCAFEHLNVHGRMRAESERPAIELIEAIRGSMKNKKEAVLSKPLAANLELILHLLGSRWDRSRDAAMLLLMEPCLDISPLKDRSMLLFESQTKTSSLRRLDSDAKLLAVCCARGLLETADFLRRFPEGPMSALKLKTLSALLSLKCEAAVDCSSIERAITENARFLDNESTNDEEEEEEEVSRRKTSPWKSAERQAWYRFKAAAECAACLGCSGDALLSSLLSLRHSGAIAVAQASLEAVARRSTVEERGAWLQRCLEVTGRDDETCTLRRSAGLASAVLALLDDDDHSSFCTGLLLLLNDRGARPRAKALNVLAAVVDRAPKLAALVIIDGESLSAAAARRGLELVEDAEWTVRTAATLALTTVVKRSLDDGPLSMQKLRGFESALQAALVETQGDNTRCLALLALKELRVCPASLRDSVLDCASSTQFTVRAAAAEALKYSKGNLASAIADRLVDKNNALHGLLRCCSRALRLTEEEDMLPLLRCASGVLSNERRPALVRLEAFLFLRRVADAKRLPENDLLILDKCQVRAWHTMFGEAALAGGSLAAGPMCAAVAREILERGAVADALAPLANPFLDEEIAVSIADLATSVFSSEEERDEFDDDDDDDDDFAHDFEELAPSEPSQLDSDGVAALLSCAMRAVEASLPNNDHTAARWSPNRLSASLRLALTATKLARRAFLLPRCSPRLIVVGEALLSQEADKWAPPNAAAALQLGAAWVGGATLRAAVRRRFHAMLRSGDDTAVAASRGIARALAGSPGLFKEQADDFDALLLLGILDLASSADPPTCSAARRALCRHAPLAPREAMRFLLALRPLPQITRLITLARSFDDGDNNIEEEEEEEDEEDGSSKGHRTQSARLESLLTSLLPPNSVPPRST